MKDEKIFSEAASGGVVWKKCFKKFSKIQHASVGVSFCLGLATLQKKKLYHRCIPVNFTSKF